MGNKDIIPGKVQDDLINYFSSLFNNGYIIFLRIGLE